MDILKFAIEMEQEGEQYYKQQAERNRENSLYTVFIRLANDESYHAMVLKEKSRELPFRANPPIDFPIQNVFDGNGDFKLNTKSNPEQVDVYRMALEKEKQSVELYQNLLSESEDDKDLYEFLISQEKEHYKIMEWIVRMVDRPNEWVESAEFGRREEY